MSSRTNIFARGPRPAGFDLSFELLASLPPTAPVPLKTLAQDLGLTARELRNTIGYLVKSGFGIRLGENQCWVDPASRHRIARAADRYWDLVWAKRLAS